MNEETHQKLMTIKRSFRLLMNGPGSQSMRDKGLGYKLNWGVPFYELKKMAEEYGKDYDLAIELWKEDIRECKILATLIMPADKMLPEITDLWMEQVQSQEMAEMLAFNLLQHVDYAPVIAYQWIASDKPLYEIAGFQLLARLFANGKEPNERGINEFLDQAATALQGDNMGINMLPLMRFSVSATSVKISRKLQEALSRVSTRFNGSADAVRNRPQPC
mgnify:CR=1 FL=1